MVLLVTTTRILAALETLPSSSRSDLNLPDSLTLESPIAHDQLIRLSRHLRTSNDDTHRTWTLNSLLQGTKVYRPPPPPKPEPSPEYLAQKARLLAAAEKRAYERMMHPNASTTTTAGDHAQSTSPYDQNQLGQDTLTPSLVLNMFLSVLLTGFSVYWALTMFRTSDIRVPFISGAKNGAGMSEPVRVLVSLLSAAVVGIAESVIYAVYLDKISRARAKEGRVKERKVVVGRDAVGGRDDRGGDHDEKMKEGEEIWGRGVNGGVRRRVRERWGKETEG